MTTFGHQPCVFATQVLARTAHIYLQGDLTLDSFSSIVIKRIGKDLASPIANFIGVPERFGSYIKAGIKTVPKILVDVYHQKEIDFSKMIKYSVDYGVNFLLGKNPYPHEEDFEFKVFVNEIMLSLAANTITNQNIQGCFLNDGIIQKDVNETILYDDFKNPYGDYLNQHMNMSPVNDTEFLGKNIFVEDHIEL